MSRILVVEDEPSILRAVADNLADEGYEVLTAADGESGYRLLKEKKPDLVILDLMLPKLSGYEVCRKSRQEGIQTPILMLTARTQEADRIVGLDMGADDYVTKPFSIGELLARVRALLRRVRPEAAPLEMLHVSGVTVDFRSYEARRGDKELEMTPKEFHLLRALASRPGEVIRREDLLNEVWGYESFPTTRTVDTHVGQLRAKIEPDPGKPRHLLTVHGVGYKWSP